MSEQRHAALGIHGTEHGKTSAPPRAKILKRARFVGAGILGLLMLGAAATVLVRVSKAHSLAESTSELARPYVTTINAKPAGKSEALTLPGTLQGFIESPIYARTSGYVLHWNKDIGSHVTKGEVLAEIDSP